MPSAQNIKGLMLLGAYLLVMLHNSTPHFHTDGGRVVAIEAHHGHGHDHDHGHHGEPVSDTPEPTNNAHPLSDLFSSLPHTSSGENLAHIVPDNKVTALKIKSEPIISFLHAWVLPPDDGIIKAHVPHALPPPAALYLSPNTALRAPPALS